MLHGLEGTDRPAELLPGLCIVDTQVQDPLDNAHELGANGHSRNLDRALERGTRPISGGEDVGRGDHDLREIDLVELAGGVEGRCRGQGDPRRVGPHGE